VLLDMRRAMKKLMTLLATAAALALAAPAKAGSLEATIVLYFAHCTDERMPVTLNALVSSQFDDAYSPPLNLTDTLVEISRQERLLREQGDEKWCKLAKVVVDDLGRKAGSREWLETYERFRLLNGRRSK
jgi:hypothetical protein